MNCSCCYEHDGSQVPAVAPDEMGFPLCRECIERDAVRVIWPCVECGEERKIPAKEWLDGDWRCDDCVTDYSRACADADAGRR